MIALPRNRDMEMAVLCACMKDVSAYAHAKTKIHTDEVFYDGSCRIVWQSINRTFDTDTRLDYHLVLDDLIMRGELQTIGGVSFLTSVICACSTSAYIEPHVNRLLTAYTNRGIITETSGALEGMNANAAEISDIASDLSESLDKLSLQNNRDGGIVTFRELQDEITTILSPQTDESLLKLSSGNEGIDILCGILPGIYMLAGPPGHLKSALALSIAKHRILTADEVVLWMGYEMPGKQTILRLISMLSGVSNQMLVQNRLSDYEKTQVARFMGHGSLNQLLLNNRNYELDELIRHIIHQKANHGDRLQVVVIDYLQLIPIRGVNRHDTAARAGALRDAQARIKSLTNDYGLCVILVVGVSAEWHQYEWPSNELLAECKSAHDPDVMMWMWNKSDLQNSADGEVDIICTKNRFGQPDIAIPCKYRKETMEVRYDDSGRTVQSRVVGFEKGKHKGNGSRQGFGTIKRPITAGNVPF